LHGAAIKTNRSVILSVQYREPRVVAISLLDRGPVVVSGLCRCFTRVLSGDVGILT